MQGCQPDFTGPLTSNLYSKIMTCEETQKSFSPYLDGGLARTVRAQADAHLEVCPVCRLELSHARSITRSLANLERPLAPHDLAASINELILIERAARRQQPTGSLPERFLHWLEPRLMPYTAARTGFADPVHRSGQRAAPAVSRA